MERHLMRMAEKARTHDVTYIGGDLWEVVSGESGEHYLVTEDGNGHLLCNCLWGQNHPRTRCSHTLAIGGEFERYLADEPEISDRHDEWLDEQFLAARMA